MKDEWHQQAVIHCPDYKCDGMLLENPFCHELKCGKCGKYWMEITHFVETTKPEG